MTNSSATQTDATTGTDYGDNAAKSTTNNTLSPADLDIIAGEVYVTLPSNAQVTRISAIENAKTVLQTLELDPKHACHVVLHMEKQYNIQKQGQTYFL